MKIRFLNQKVYIRKDDGMIVEAGDYERPIVMGLIETGSYVRVGPKSKDVYYSHKVLKSHFSVVGEL